MTPHPGRILVTGAEGFVGGHLLTALRAAFPDATLLTRRFDVADPGATQAAVAASRPDAVVHLAAIAAPMEATRDPGLAWSVNLHGTLNLAAAVLEHARDAVLLFAGSGECYGKSFQEGRRVDEGFPLAPTNTYAATKAAADLALGALASQGLRVVRARPFNHTGPGQAPAFVTPAFARQVARIAAGLQPPVLDVGALEPQRDFLDVRDVCDAYVRCLATPLEPGAIVNIASGTPRRVGDVLSALVDMAGITPEIRTDAARLRPDGTRVAIGDAAFARRALGWEPRIPWRQTLSDVLADWRARVAVAP